MIVATIYIDSALFCDPNKAIVDEVKAHFMQRWEYRDLGKACKFLHMLEWLQDIHQSMYLSQYHS